MSKNRKKQVKQPFQSTGFNTNPFAGLDIPGKQPDEPLQENDSSGSESNQESSGLFNQKLTVRIEKKGRRGKTVTVIQGFNLVSETTVEDVCRQLKRSLGIGGCITEAGIELQGNKKDEIRDGLKSIGFRFVK